MSRAGRTKELLYQLGIQPKKSLGQNFLIGDGVVETILNKVKELSPMALVEVGPGLGALTEGLLQLALPLTLIEMDSKMADYWRVHEAKVIEVDALKLDWSTLNITPRTVLVSNLPYQIGGSLVVDRCFGPPGIESMVLMFQKEVAQRLLSLHKSKEYGFLTVVAQTFWSVEYLLEAAPNEFYPSPQIASRVLVFRRKPVTFDKRYVDFVKKAFSQRRKQWLKVLKAQDSNYQWVDELGRRGYKETVRAEEVSVEDFKGLFSEWNRSGNPMKSNGIE